MLPRHTPKTARPVSSRDRWRIDTLFRVWQKFLGSMAHSLSCKSTRLLASGSGVLGDLKMLVYQGQAPTNRPVGGILVASGLAVTFGATISALLAIDKPLQVASSALLTVVWVAVRLPVMLLAYAPASKPESQRVAAAWSVGTLPYLFAVAPSFRAVAWITGAILAFRVLATDGNRPRALRTILVGFGIEASGVVAVLLARNIRVLLEIFGS